MCRAAGIICNVNGSVETGVGNLGNLHLAVAAEAVTLSDAVSLAPTYRVRSERAWFMMRRPLPPRMA